MHCIRNRRAFTLLVAGVLLVVFGFAACSDALITAPRVTRPRPDAAIPVADATADPAPIIVAAGDVAQCSSLGDEATALLLDSLQFDAVLALGDLAYEDGTATQFQNCYDPTWGRHKAKTRPAPGNHEYHTANAAGYFSYFGAAANPDGGGQSYYSFNLGEWHILSLDSNIPVSPGSPQLTWIGQDLAANPKACSLAYWHHPVFSSGLHGNSSLMRDVWRVLDSAGVDVVLVGHDHTYERFAPQTSTGIASTIGIREFVVGTGGSKLRSFSTTRANSELRDNNTWGVLKLTLHPTTYEWQFVPVAGETFTDQGTADCVQVAPPEANQQPVATLTEPADGATFTAPAAITLSATASDADGNLNRVEFYRGSTFIGSDATAPYSITWTNAAAGSYTLTARAVDDAEAWASSTTVRVTVTPPSNSAPTVSLTSPLDDANFTAPATITLEATATDVDGNLSRVEFYEGTTLLGSDATAPYAFTWNNVAAGTYTLTARAIDAADAAASSAEAVITVDAPSPSNQPPVANPGGPYSGTEGVTLTVSGETSTDPENGALTYAWNFGDGTTATGPSPSKTYGDNGTFTVTLVVTDPVGASHTATTTATIANVAPTTLTFVSPPTAASGVSYTLSITEATDVAADQVGLEYRFECGGPGGFTPWGAASSVSCPGLSGPLTSTVRGAVRDKDGGTRQQSRAIEILAPSTPNSAPTVSLSAPADNATFTAPAAITLEATASDVDANLSRVEFYQGTTLLGSATATPYSFSWTNVAAGSYILTARAVDAADAATTSAQVRVTVNAPSPSNQPPVANPGGPYGGTEGVALTLDGGGSSDPESGALTYAWNFGDGTTATGPAPSKTYGDNGTFTITLVVTDPGGASHTATTTATIANVAPTTLTFVSPPTAASGVSYTLSITNATDVAADQVGLEYRFECGGPGGYTPWSAASSVTCEGGTGPATRTVRGAVRDKDGGTRQQSRTLEILAPSTPPPNSAPTVSLSTPADNATFTAPATITLEASAADVDGNLNRVEFYNGPTLLGSDATAPYAFTWTDVPAGSYTLTARAVDASEAAATSAQVVVTVNAPPPPNQPPVANPGGPYSGMEGVALTLDGSASTDPENAALTYSWHFGDGTSGTGPSPSKAYGDNGTYTVTLTVSDPSGASHTATTTATIANVAPTGIFSAPATAASGVAYTLAITSASDAAADQPGLEYRFECGGGYTLWGPASFTSCPGVTGPVTRVVRGAMRDKDGGVREFSANVNVLASPNSAPSVSLTTPLDGASLTAPATITLSAVAADVDGNLSRVEFYHGATLLGSATTSPYSFTWTNVSAGSYTLTARAVDAADAATTSAGVRVTVNAAPPPNQPPVANPGGAYTGTEGVALTLDAAGSSDPENGQLTYAWNFGDGTTGTGRSPSKVYADNGTYTITLVVADPAGASHSATTTATVSNVAPRATLTAPPVPVNEGSTFTLALDAAADAAGDLPSLQFAFDCGGGSGFGPFGAASATSCATVSNGTRAARAAVRDKDGATSEYSASVQVVNVAPSVTITNAPTTVKRWETYSVEFRFTDPGVQDGPWSYRIDWGDGESSGPTNLATQGGLVTASHRNRKTSGTTVTVTIRVTDKDGAIGQAITTMNSANEPPVANAGGPYTGTEGMALSLNGGGSTDPENATLTYAWDFGDGTTGTGASPSKAYADNGTYTITLVVSDPAGESHTATTTATIANVAPAGTFSAPTTVESGAAYNLAIAGATDVAADRPGLQYQFDCGAGLGAWSTAFSTTCPAVAGPATRAVRGVVRDKDGGVREFSANVSVLAPPNSAPSVSVTGPSDGATFTAPATVTLSAIAADVDGNLSRVEFLSGTAVLGSDGTAPYTFTWSNVPAGSYTVTARAVDAVGAATSSAGVRVTVNAGPVANGGGPYTGAEGVALTLDGGGSSDPENGQLSYTWNFGDGTTGTGRSPSQVYADNGTYTITLVVADPLGASHSATTTATIANVVPTGVFSAPPTVESGAAYTLAITNAADVAADRLTFEYRFDCGDGFKAWGSATSASCAGGGGPATRAVRGALRDKDGGVREFSANVEILNMAPTVSLTGPSDGATFTAPATITLSATASDVDGNLSRVEFLNGTTVIGSVTTSPYSFTWSNVPAGSYILTARAVDAVGAATTSTQARVTVVNTPPVANAGGPYTGMEGVALAVDGGGSTDPNGDVLTYAWNFGDGTTASGRSPSKTYADNGTYTVTIVVSDPSGASHSVTTTATIANVAPTMTLVAPATVKSGEQYTLAITGAADVAADQPGLEYRFDCGSGFGVWGSASSMSCPGSTGPATRTVGGAVRDKDGGTRQQSRDVEIVNSAPTVSLIAPLDGANLTAPATVVLEATAADIDGNLSRVDFYQGATLLGSDATAPYTFTWSAVSAGSYVLTARAVDAVGAATTSTEARVTVVNTPPVSDPGAPYTGTEGVALTLNGDGSTDPNGDALTYAWNFGDGTTATSRSPSKVYADNGTYTITLVVSDPLGASHSATTTATIANVAPTGMFSAPATVESGAPYTLAIANATDVAADRPSLEYRFDCGAGYAPWGSASSASCAGGAGPATRAVRGELRDKDGGVREFSASVGILNMAPTVSLTAPLDGATVAAPATITLEASAADVDGNLSRVEFYNGATLLGSDATAPYAFTWSNIPAGSYTLTARAVDAAESAATSTEIRMTVSNQPPVSNPGGPYSGTEGLALTLNGAGSTDPNGDALTYAWNFGDGTTATGASPSKTYADNGTYTITLTVSDPLGATHSATTTTTIANVAPTGTFSAPATAASGAAYTLAISNASDVAADQPGLQYQFDCGAGYSAWASSSSLTCAGVAGPATRAVRGGVRDKDGGTRTFSANVDILPPPAYFLVLDNSSIAEGGSPNNFTASQINRDLSNYATRTELRWFAANVGRTITVYSGSVGGEGFHAVKTIPASWNTAGPTADGLRNYLLAGPGLGSPNTSSGQTLLSSVPDVTPLRATGLRLLIGQPVCALVRDGNVSTSYNPLRGNLTGRYLGIVAFVVNAVTPRSGNTTLPAVSLTVRDADAVCAGALQRLMAAPAPTSSSSPNDTGK
jgi:PKD repeat protein